MASQRWSHFSKAEQCCVRQTELLGGFGNFLNFLRKLHAGGIDARFAFLFGAVQFLRMEPDLAADERVVSVAVCDMV